MNFLITIGVFFYPIVIPQTLIHPSTSQTGSSEATKPMPGPACMEKKAAGANGPQRPKQLCAGSSGLERAARPWDGDDAETSLPQTLRNSTDPSCVHRTKLSPQSKLSVLFRDLPIPAWKSCSLLHYRRQNLHQVEDSRWKTKIMWKVWLQFPLRNRRERKRGKRHSISLEDSFWQD